MTSERSPVDEQRGIPGEMTGENPTLDRRDEEELVEFLEPDQLVTDKSRPLPRAQLSRREGLALWALRVFVIVVSAMVIYTFFSQLGS